MAQRYSATVTTRQPPSPPATLPLVWLLSDARNDARLAHHLACLPEGSGFVFRHYHLPPEARRARFEELAGVARARAHLLILAGPPDAARSWDADGSYGPPALAAGGLLRLATAHDAGEIAQAVAAGADGIFLSPVFATRSHPGGETLGNAAFLALARACPIPVIALGGMNAARAQALGWPRWGAIDGFDWPMIA